MSEHEPATGLPAAASEAGRRHRPSPRRPASGCPTSPSTGRVTPSGTSRAVFYEVLIRGFQDANGDGTGDIRGLTARLDYLQWLGIDCIWLLPIYESPLRDGGYDIADYLRILPEYGNIADFVELVEQAHKRGIRIIADLVMNHTSDQHPWFQASRVGAGRALRRLLRVERRRRTSTRTRGSSSSTPRPRTGRSTRCAASTSGTGSSRTSRT